MKTMTGAMVMALVLAAVAQDTAEDARRKLAAQKIAVDFQETSLEDAIAFLRDATGLNFHISSTVAEHAPDATVRIKLRDVSVGTVLKLMLQPHELWAIWRDGSIVILPRGEAKGSKVMKIYDIRAQILKLQDYPGPRVELVDPSDQGAGFPGMLGITVDYEPEPPIPGDMLVELIEMNTGGDSWQDDTDVSINLANGRLVVTQSPAVHREITKLLRKLEQYR